MCVWIICATSLDDTVCYFSLSTYMMHYLAPLNISSIKLQQFIYLTAFLREYEITLGSFRALVTRIFLDAVRIQWVDWIKEQTDISLGASELAWCVPVLLSGRIFYMEYVFPSWFSKWFWTKCVSNHEIVSDQKNPSSKVGHNQTRYFKDERSILEHHFLRNIHLRTCFLSIWINTKCPKW